MINDHRSLSSGGGVALYVKSEYSFTLRNDLKIDTIENIWIETSDLIVGVIYNPPAYQIDIF